MCERALQPSVEEVQLSPRMHNKWLSRALEVLRRASGGTATPDWISAPLLPLEPAAEGDAAEGADENDPITMSSEMEEKVWARAVILRARELQDVGIYPSDEFNPDRPDGPNLRCDGPIVSEGASREQNSAQVGATGNQNALLNFNASVPFSTRRGRHFWNICNCVFCSPGYTWTSHMDGNDNN